MAFGSILPPSLRATHPEPSCRIRRSRDIESDPALAGTKLIAEAWDAGGLYQVGSFVGDSWKEWNDRFRDDTRDFFRGSDNSAGRMADRLLGSPEHLRPRRIAKPRRASISLRATMASRSATSPPTTTSTTRRTAKATAMAKSRTELGTADSKAPRTIAASRGCAIGK